MAILAHAQFNTGATGYPLPLIGPSRLTDPTANTTGKCAELQQAHYAPTKEEVL